MHTSCYNICCSSGNDCREGRLSTVVQVGNTSQPHYCACVTAVDYYTVCDQENQISSLRQASCMFYISDVSNVVAAWCPLFFPKSVIKDNLIPLSRNITELNRFVCGSLSRVDTGPLCGKCTNGTRPSIYSVGNECVPCSGVNIGVFYTSSIPSLYLVISGCHFVPIECY